MKLRIGLDIDDTICAFYNPYLERFGTPHSDSEITRNVSRVLIKDKEFWLGLPITNRPDFCPALYCTKRVHPKEWTREFLVINGLPVMPIYQVYCQKSSKAPRIKGRVDVFIEDSISNFIDLNLNGIPCLLIDNEFNRSWGPVGRIFSLKEEEIVEAYNLFMATLFPCFKDLL